MGRKHKRRKTPTKNKPKTIKKTLIGSHILIITLNISGLNAPTKYIQEAKGMEGKASACNAGDLGLIPELGRSPGKGNGYPLQYSCLENSMDRGGWTAPKSPTKSWTQLGG